MTQLYIYPDITLVFSLLPFFSLNMAGLPKKSLWIKRKFFAIFCPYHVFADCGKVQETVGGCLLTVT